MRPEEPDKPTSPAASPATDVPQPPAAPPRPPRLERFRRRWLRAPVEVWWFFLLALGVRALAAVLSPAVLNDSVDLLAAAARVETEGLAAVLHVSHHPLPVWLIARLSRFLDPELAATGLAALGGALAVWPLHTLARHTCGRHAATAACLIYAVLPRAVGVTAVPMVEGLYLPLALTSMSLALSARLGGAGWIRGVRLLGAGSAAGAAYLCRPEGLVVGATAVLAAWLLARPGRRVLTVAVVALAFAVVAAPYVTALSRDRGHLSLSPKKDLGRFAGVAKSPAAQSFPAVQSPSAIPTTRAGGHDLGTAVRKTAAGLAEAATLPALLLALLGILARSRWRRRRSVSPRAVTLLGILALVALVVRLNLGWGYGGSRHCLGAAVFLLPFAGEGLYVLGGFFPRVTSRRRFVIFAAAILAMPLTARTLLRPPGENGARSRRLGELLAANAVARGPAPTLSIGTFGEPRVAYYAARVLERHGGGARDVRLWGRYRGLLDNPTRAGTRTDLARWLREKQATHVVLHLFATRERLGIERNPARELADALQRDGLLSEDVVSAGSRLAAFRVLRK